MLLSIFACRSFAVVKYCFSVLFEMHFRPVKSTQSHFQPSHIYSPLHIKRAYDAWTLAVSALKVFLIFPSFVTFNPERNAQRRTLVYDT